MSDTTTVSVRILDKEYQVSCRQDEVDALTSSARYLDQQMRQIRESGKVFGPIDRVWPTSFGNVCGQRSQASAFSRLARRSIGSSSTLPAGPSTMMQVLLMHSGTQVPRGTLWSLTERSTRAECVAGGERRRVCYDT